jgi:carbonic anhydrase/acetyltransferase-like protein (isoleucine patch superfamily)
VRDGFGHGHRTPTDATPPRYRRLVPIYALGDDTPEIHPDAFVHPDAVVIGAVRIGAESTIWPNVVLRGDGGGRIEIGAQTSVQDGSVLHTTPEHPTIVGDGCTVGHIVHLEGCTIEDDVLIGSGSIVLHGVVVHRGAIVAANAVLLDGTDVPAGALAVGTPATIKPGRARPEEIEHGREVYVAKGREYRNGLRRIG